MHTRPAFRPVLETGSVGRRLLSAASSSGYGRVLPEKKTAPAPPPLPAFKPRTDIGLVLARDRAATPARPATAPAVRVCRC